MNGDYFDILIILTFISGFILVFKKAQHADEKAGETSDNILFNKTAYNFVHKGDLWIIVEQWAQETGFRMIREVNIENNTKRWYKKKDSWKYFLSSGNFSMLKITKINNDVSLVAWVHIPQLWRGLAIRQIFMIYLALFYPERLESDIKLESNAKTSLWIGEFDITQRTSTRNDINKLLLKLGQPAIT